MALVWRQHNFRDIPHKTAPETHICQIERSLPGLPTLITLHPSYLLRLPDAQAKADATARFEEDFADGCGDGGVKGGSSQSTS